LDEQCTIGSTAPETESQVLTIVEHLMTSPFEPVLHGGWISVKVGHGDGNVLMVTDGHCALYLTMCPLEFFFGFWANVIVPNNLG
jgi:hypothetical protein